MANQSVRLADLNIEGERAATMRRSVDKFQLLGARGVIPHRRFQAEANRRGAIRNRALALRAAGRVFHR